MIPMHFVTLQNVDRFKGVITYASQCRCVASFILDHDSKASVLRIGKSSR